MTLFSLPPSGAVLSFDKESYTFEDGSVKVRVRSSRPLPESSLRDLVIIAVTKKNIATIATSDTSGAKDTSDTSMFEIKGGLMDVITCVYRALKKR